MDSESLRIFVAVAAELSITHAAARLGRVPSNVTTRIQQLEADVGAPLFIRAGKRISLSSAGVRFLDYAQRLLALADEARHVVTDGRAGGTLRIGTMESTAASRLPGVLAAFNAKHPATRIELGTGPSRQLLEQVRDGRLDGAFVALPLSLGGLTGLKDLGLSAQKLWREALLLLLPGSERDVRRASGVKTRALAAFKQGCTYRAMAEERLGVAGSAEWTIHEMGSYHAMMACVAAGTCVTLLPASVLALSEAASTLPTLSAGHADTYLVWREGFAMPAFRDFRDALSQA